MTIQNIRYNGRFQYEADVDPSILGYEMLKLVLQPLVVARVAKFVSDAE